MGIVLGLLGRYWKYLAVIAVLVGVLVWHQHAVHDYGDAQYKRGADAALAKVKTAIAKKDAENRAKEIALNKATEDFAKRKAHDDADRHDDEQKHADRITKTLNDTPFLDVPQCSLPKEILADRNAIRGLGPKE